MPLDGMEPLGGFGPPTYYLQGSRSNQAKLQRHGLVRDEGFEPPKGHLEGGSAKPGYSNPAQFSNEFFWRGIGVLPPFL
jgi:hypothetical protein